MSRIFDKNIDFTKWYTSLVMESELIEYGMVKGTMVLKPYAYSIWTNIQKGVDKYLKKMGTENCYFPLMIPYSEFVKESKHIEGFAPELFKISKIGDKVLDDELVIRPTSEIAFCNYFRTVCNSYNDLPIVLNQWCSAFRVEKNTRPFLRNSEFLWQEQHAIFSDSKEAKSFSFRMINVYKDFLNKFLCLPVLMGEKTEYERFAGASNTFTCEALMQDGQALQVATSHYLSTNFSKNFNVKFQTKNNNFDYVHQTSAGCSTRTIGAMILVHSDNKGLILPSLIAPYRFVIVTNSETNAKVDKLLSTVKKALGSIMFKHDNSDRGMGSKLEEYEIKGVPFQIIIGNKEVENNQITIYKRTTQEKIVYPIEHISFDFFRSLLTDHDRRLFEKAKNFLNDSIVRVNNLEEFILAIKNKKIALALWSGDQEDEKRLKELTGATSRCISWDHNVEYQQSNEKKCFFTNKDNAKLVYFARAY